jgi:hypothetical protein
LRKLRCRRAWCWWREGENEAETYIRNSTSPNDLVRDVTRIIVVGGIKVGKEPAPKIAAPCSYAAQFPTQGINVAICCSDQRPAAIMRKCPNVSNNSLHVFMLRPILQQCVVDSPVLSYQYPLT